MTKPIRGSIFGLFGSKPKKPRRDPDNLNSRQYITVQELISEGEIEGWATAERERKAALDADANATGWGRGEVNYNTAALKDVFLDNTPVLHKDAVSTDPEDRHINYPDVTFTPRFGTANQAYVSGIKHTSTNVNISTHTAVTTTQPYSFDIALGTTIENVDGADAAKVTITFPQLYETNDKGDLLGRSVEIQITVQYTGGSETAYLTDTISGRTNDAYSRSYRIDFTQSTGTVTVKVKRVTQDNSSNEEIKDIFKVTGVEAIEDDHSSYPDSAYGVLTLDSKVVSSVPSRKYRIRGIKIRIPGAGASNSGTPTIDSETGRIVYPTNYIFNGTMGAAQWCTCPAMVLLDLLTSIRYGLGEQIAPDYDPDNPLDSDLFANIDLYSFVEASKYSNTLVSDGFGSTEPRFSCNVNILSAKEAFNLIEELSGVMRCMPIWAAGRITISQDKPTDASFLFSLANVTEEGFSYSGSSLKTRHSAVSVSYYNMDSREIDFELVEDTVLKGKFGYLKRDVKAFACTSRGQAQRLGKAILFAEQQETEVVAFTTSIENGVAIRPGSIIDINDPVRSGARRSGRIKSATTTSITVDGDQDLSSFGGGNKKVKVLLSNNVIEEKSVTSINSGVISLGSALSETPAVNSIWFLTSDTLEPQKFRVITVEEQDGITYKVTALSYNPGKYANIEENLDLPARATTLLVAPGDPPTSYTCDPVNDEKLVVVNGVAISRLFVSWGAVPGVNQYLVQYKYESNNFEDVITYSPNFHIDNSIAGNYFFKIYSYNSNLELSSTALEFNVAAQGKTAIPADVTGLTGEPVGGKQIRLRWNRSTDADVLHGGRVYVRHSRKTDGTGAFSDSVDLVTALAGNTTEALVPILEGEYIVKFQDDGGRFSAGEASVVIDLPDEEQKLVLPATREELLSSPFSGSKSNVTLASGVLKLTSISFTSPATQKTGTYTFANVFDLGQTMTLTLKRHVQSIGVIDGTDSVDTWPNIDQRSSWDGAAANDTDCQIYVRTSNTGSADSDFSDNWNIFVNGEYKARYFQFKAVLITFKTDQNVNVSQLGYTASLPSRTEQSVNTLDSITDASADANGKTITFDKPFFVGTSALGNLNNYLPSIGITAQNMAAGDYFTVSHPSSDADKGKKFTIKFMNSSTGTTALNRKFTYQAVGFGRGV